MSRFLRLVALATAAVVVVAACSGDDQDSAATARACPVELPQSGEPVRVVFWHTMTAALEETLERLTDEYNASQDRVSVELVNQADADAVFDKYRTTDAADRPAIVQLQETATQVMVDSGTALPVATCIEASGYDTSDHLPNVLRAFTVQDTLWPMPFNTSIPVLYYNRTAFEAAGLDPDDPPTTLDEVRLASQAIVDAGAASTGISLDTGPNAGGGWFVEQWFAMAGSFSADNDNGRSARATRMLFDDPFGVELFTWLRDMVRDGLAVNVGSASEEGANLLKLIDRAEPAAMTINSSAALSSVLNVINSGVFGDAELGIGPLPGPPGDGGVIVGGAALWLTAGRSDAEIAGAWDYLQFLNTPAAQAAWAAGTGYVPVRRSAVDEPVLADLYAANPLFKVAYDQLAASPDIPETAGPLLGPHRTIRAILGEELDRMLLEGAEPAAAVAAAAERADAELADYTERVGG